MTGRNVIHDTFTIERTYDMAPASVFAAFSTEEARNSWGDPGDLEQPKDEGANHVTEFDFRAGGRECFTTEWEGTTYRYDGRYHDIVTSSRIVYSYAMYADNTLISVSLASIEFAESGEEPSSPGPSRAPTWTGITGRAPPRCVKAGRSR
jgi:uncharacterized protein YndB with AHSA1/START domain